MGREAEREGYIVVTVQQHSYGVHFCDDAEEAVQMSERLADAVYDALCEVGHTGTVLLAKIVHIDRSDFNATGQNRRRKGGSISEMESITVMDISDFLDKQFQASDIAGDEELEEVSTGMDAGKTVEIGEDDSKIWTKAEMQADRHAYPGKKYNISEEDYEALKGGSKVSEIAPDGEPSVPEILVTPHELREVADELEMRAVDQPDGYEAMDYIRGFRFKYIKFKAGKAEEGGDKEESP